MLPLSAAYHYATSDDFVKAKIFFKILYIQHKIKLYIFIKITKLKKEIYEFYSNKIIFIYLTFIYIYFRYKVLYFRIRNLGY